LSIERRIAAGSATLALTGEIDLSTCAKLAAAIDAAVDGGANAVAVDLAGVTFLDSTGVNALVQGKRKAESVGAQYRVVGAGGMAARVLKLVGVLDVLTGNAP
jgi:anti-sigma B factor antagonist